MAFWALPFPPLLVVFFGGGRFITQGPTNATAVLLFGVFAAAGLIGANGLATDAALDILPVVLFFLRFASSSRKHISCVPLSFNLFPEL